MKNSKEFINKNKETQNKLLDYIIDDEDDTENLEKLQTLFNDTNIRNDKHDLTTLLHLITKIGNHHHRMTSFFDKLEKIIIIFKEDIKKFFSNSEIFNIFRSNKKILLFLIEEKILIFDENIAKKINTKKYKNKFYPQYFLPEIKPFISKKWLKKYHNNTDLVKNELPENFYEKRKTGENESYICKLIRDDSVENFVQYTTQNCYSLNSKITQSIYETNSYLIKNNKPSLIEYAAFFGSIQIFQYLRFNNVELKKSLWLYAIHGNNPEMIHLLEEILYVPTNNEYIKYFYESIKCHHNEIANYFHDNHLNNHKKESHDTFSKCLKYYNFAFISDDSINKFSFLDICKYDYYLLSRLYLEELNKNEIQNHDIQ